MYYLLTFSFQASSNTNTEYIPENATSVYRLDGRVLSRELLASLLISEDEDLRKMTQSKIPTTSDGEVKPVGISFDSDIIFFRLTEHGNAMTGFLFNLWDHKKFRRNMPKYIGTSGAIAATDDVGIVLLEWEGRLNQVQLKERAKKLLEKETNFARKYPAPSSDAIVSVWYKEKDTQISDVALTLQANEIVLSGTIQANHSIKNKSLNLYEGGFHIHTAWFPEVWNSVLQNELIEIGVELPSIRQFSVNYFGTHIVAEPNVAALPIMAGEVEFNTPVYLDSLMPNFPYTVQDSASGFRTYDIYSRQYQISQINRSTISFRSNATMNLKKKQMPSVAELSGSPKHLLKLEGDDFIRRILSLSNEYRATNAFVREVEHIDIKLLPSGGHQYTLKGKISLKDETWPLNELIKFLIRSKLF
jgi:hypothetical protein